MEHVKFLIRDASFKERIIRVLNDNFSAIDLSEPRLEDGASDEVRYVVYRKGLKENDEKKGEELFVIFGVIKYDREKDIVGEREGVERDSILSVMEGRNEIFGFHFDYRINHSFDLFFHVMDVVIDIIERSEYASSTLVEDSYTGSFMSFKDFRSKWLSKRGFFFQE